MRGATDGVVVQTDPLGISIHAPLAGCDIQAITNVFSGLDFNPRTPCGVRLAVRLLPVPISIFQSTHPLRGATLRLQAFRAQPRISIHAPLAGCDPGLQRLQSARLNFNPRTPCGVRHFTPDKLTQRRTFQSTHPLRGATSRPAPARSLPRHFNPRTPCGVRPCRLPQTPMTSPFQSTHPLRGATLCRHLPFPLPSISIHAPLAGCDQVG